MSVTNKLDPTIALRVLSVDAEISAVNRLQDALKIISGTEANPVAQDAVFSIQKAYATLPVFKPNVIIIDLITTALRDSVTFVQHVRAKHPTIVFILSARESEMDGHAEEIYYGWGSRLKQYFFLPKDPTDSEFLELLLFNLMRAQLDLYAYGTKQSLSRAASNAGEPKISAAQFSKLKSQISQYQWDLELIHDQAVRPAEEGFQRAFVIMPFDDDTLDDVYGIGIKECLEAECQLVPSRVDDHYRKGLLIRRIYEDIHGSAVVIAELSHPRPNCYFELGFAEALGKPIVRLARKGTTLPFDVNQYHFVFYSSIQNLRSQLKSALQDLGVIA